MLENPAHASKVVEAIAGTDCSTAMEFWTLLLAQWNRSPSPSHAPTSKGTVPPFVASPAGVHCVRQLHTGWTDLLGRTAGALDHKAKALSEQTSTDQGLQDHVVAQAVSGWDPRPSRQLLKARSTGYAARKLKRTHRKRVDPSAADWAAAGGGVDESALVEPAWCGDAYGPVFRCRQLDVLVCMTLRSGCWAAAAETKVVAAPGQPQSET